MQWTFINIHPKSSNLWVSVFNFNQIINYSFLQRDIFSGAGEDGETPLHLAASHGRLAAAQQLLQAGATMSLDHMRRAPLHFAAAKGHLETAELLLNAKDFRLGVVSVSFTF